LFFTLPEVILKLFQDFFFFYPWLEVIIYLFIPQSDFPYISESFFFQITRSDFKTFSGSFVFFFSWLEVIIYFPKWFFLILPKVLFFMTGSGYFVPYISGSDFFLLFTTKSGYDLFPKVIFYILPKVIFFRNRKSFCFLHDRKWLFISQSDICILPKVIFFMTGSGSFVFYMTGSDYLFPKVIFYILPKVIFFHDRKWLFCFLHFPLFMTGSDYLFINFAKWFFFMTGSGYFVFYITGSDFKTFPEVIFSFILARKWLSVYLLISQCDFFFILPKVIFCMTGSDYIFISQSDFVSWQEVVILAFT